MNCQVCGRFMRKWPRCGLPPDLEFENGGPYEWRCVKVFWDGDDGGMAGGWVHD